MQLFTHLWTVVHLSTAKGLNTRFSLVDPTCKSFEFTQKIEIVENKEQLFDFAIPFYFISLCFNALAVASQVSQTNLWEDSRSVLIYI